MPTRNVPTREHPSPIRAPGPSRSPTRSSFKFPSDQHLLVTTQKEVLAWDQQGLDPLFQSGSKGILAAREAYDGSGLLAVADSHLVVLHDARKASDRSYKLHGTVGKVRLLEYTRDSQSIFFTTSLQNAVQIYSLKQSALLDPLHDLPSPPTVLALSNTSHLLITASENPPAVYLHNLVLKTPPRLLQPRASSSAVDVITFHPDRANIFLLGFRDGTLAAYDASRIPVPNGQKHSRQTGEISSLKSLHMVVGRQETSIAAEGGEGVVRRSTAITGAAFIKGYQTRAVSTGRDGRARIVDFDQGGKMLRTWHIKAPGTCLSVLQAKPPVPSSPGKKKAHSRAGTNLSTSSSLQSSSDYTIAIGRQDGKVVLYNSLGLLLKEMPVDRDAKPVISVHWMDGIISHDYANSIQSSSIPISEAEGESAQEERASNASSEKLGKESVVEQRDALSPSAKAPVTNSAVDSNFDPNQLSPTEASWPAPVGTPEISPLYIDNEAPHEDDMSGTVNYTPLKGTVQRQLPQIPTSYMDLFSPVKPEAPVNPDLSPRRNTRARIRPRLRSSTFVDKSSQDAAADLKGSLGSTQGDQLEVPILSHNAATKVQITDETQHESDHEPQSDSPEAWETSDECISPRQDPQSEDTINTLLERTAIPTHKLAIRRTPKKKKTRSSEQPYVPGAYISSEPSLFTAGDSLASSSVDILSGLRKNQTDGTGGGPSRIGNIAMLAPYMNKPHGPPKPSNKSIDSLVKRLPAQESPPLNKVLDVDEDIWCTSTEESPSSLRPSRKNRRSHHLSDGFSPSMQSDGTLEDVPFRSTAFLPKGVVPIMAAAVPPRPSRPPPHPLHQARPRPLRSPRSPGTFTTAIACSSVDANLSPEHRKAKKKGSPSGMAPGAARCDPLQMHEWFPRGSSRAKAAPKPNARRSAADAFGTPLRRHPKTKNSSNRSPLPYDASTPTSSRDSPLLEPTPSPPHLNPQEFPHDSESLCSHSSCVDVRHEVFKLRAEMEEMKSEMRELRNLIGGRDGPGVLGAGQGRTRHRAGKIVDTDMGIPTLD